MKKLKKLLNLEERMISKDAILILYVNLIESNLIIFQLKYNKLHNYQLFQLSILNNFNFYFRPVKCR